MSKRQLDALMWAQACAAMERAERLRRQFFHHGTPYWEAPIDIFESDDALIILVALPGVELETISVTMSAGTLTVTGQRPLPRELENARIVRLEIPHGRFERRWVGQGDRDAVDLAVDRALDQVRLLAGVRVG